MKTALAPMSIRLKKRSAAAGLLAFALTVTFIAWHNVPGTPTAEDQPYLDRILNAVPPLPERPSLAEEIAFVRAVQAKVLSVTPHGDAIPQNRAREPKDLFEARTAQCFDRSRTIEKALRKAGFAVRHIAVYTEKKTGSAFQALISPGESSHAVSEVRTSDGWLVVDSNDPWVSIDSQNRPRSMEDVSRFADGEIKIEWAADANPAEIMQQPFAFVYGLYSRHGRHYPPFDLVPDLNYAEFAQNFF